MKFQSRNLKRYAEPISHELLEVGEVYFALRFVDEEILVPILEPIVFIGRNLARGDTDRVYFQDAVSYRDGVRYGRGAAEKGAEFSKAQPKRFLLTKRLWTCFSRVHCEDVGLDWCRRFVVASFDGVLTNDAIAMTNSIVPLCRAELFRWTLSTERWGVWRADKARQRATAR
jgi:hypothetical protein